MNLDNTVIFIFVTILNVSLWIAMAMFARFLWTEEEKAMSVLIACVAATACAGIEYVLIGGLLK